MEKNYTENEVTSEEIDNLLSDLKLPDVKTLTKTGKAITPKDQDIITPATKKGKSSKAKAKTVVTITANNIYDGLQESEKNELEDTAALIRDIMKQSVLLVGEQLTRIKKAHEGRFEAWIERELPFSRSKAYATIEVYKVFGKMPDVVGRLPVTGVYKLAEKQTPAAAIDKIVKAVLKGDKFSLKNIRKIIADAKPATNKSVTALEPVNQPKAVTQLNPVETVVAMEPSTDSIVASAEVAKHIADYYTGNDAEYIVRRLKDVDPDYFVSQLRKCLRALDV